MSSEKYRIPKHSVSIDLLDSSGNQRSVEVFIADMCAKEDRRERVRDILGDRHFIPVREDDQFSFVSRRHITWLRIDLMAAFDELDPEAERSEGSVTAGVKVELEDGTTVEGGLRYLLPRQSRRVSDYLERIDGFVPIRTPDWLYLVNVDRVVRIVPIDEVT